jgi:predicted DNA-binding protein (UPF0251 family)
MTAGRTARVAQFGGTSTAIGSCCIQVVELRFFGGLTIEETAAAMNVSPQTVVRDWNVARAWLTRELRP